MFGLGPAIQRFEQSRSALAKPAHDKLDRGAFPFYVALFLFRCGLSGAISSP
jgi:hypothetical protein